MINLGLIDILLIVVLVVTLILSIKRRRMSYFFLTLFIFVIIGIERLAPGTLAAIGEGIRKIDLVNEQLPHVEIAPIITVR
jgi:hypothetical protein